MEELRNLAEKKTIAQLITSLAEQEGGSDWEAFPANYCLKLFMGYAHRLALHKLHLYCTVLQYCLKTYG
jgi:hypothetical protein